MRAASPALWGASNDKFESIWSHRFMTMMDRRKDCLARTARSACAAIVLVIAHGMVRRLSRGATPGGATCNRASMPSASRPRVHKSSLKSRRSGEKGHLDPGRVRPTVRAQWNGGPIRALHGLGVPKGRRSSIRHRAGHYNPNGQQREVTKGRGQPRRLRRTSTGSRARGKTPELFPS
ncbi:hypothetical protein EV281_110136 [Rhizobium sp. BK418]|nr:hypothetical protein EV281_110136 [Rhizobium sp. BK418]